MKRKLLVSCLAMAMLFVFGCLPKILDPQAHFYKKRAAEIEVMRESKIAEIEERKKKVLQKHGITQPTTYTPQKGDSLARVIEGMGRPPDDQFNLKDEHGNRMENNILVAYFSGNKVLVIGLIDQRAFKWQKFPAYAYYAYKQEIAYVVAGVD